MTPREKFIAALRREPITGHVPTFELVFFLTMESLGKVHPSHRDYTQWDQMTREEQQLHLTDMAKTYIDTAEKYHHSAIFVHPNPGSWNDTQKRIDGAKMILERIRELSGDKYFLMAHGDTTMAIPNGDDMTEVAVMMYEEPEKIHDMTKRHVERAVQMADAFQGTGLLDGFGMCSDYCFNVNPFYTRDMFEEFITPYLKETCDYYRSRGFYSIKHTDGNVMPILDMIVDCGPDAVHSLDPQGGVDLKKVKELYGDRVCLIGNVNCGLMQTGTEEELAADVRRALREGMPGYGYIFSTSNCAYTGLPLKRYELMNKIWWEEGIYR